jgi:uracil-DNA glycosylase family 4
LPQPGGAAIEQQRHTIAEPALNIYVLTSYRGATLIPTFHPAYLLRNPSAKRDVWDDMKKVRVILQGAE